MPVNCTMLVGATHSADVKKAAGLFDAPAPSPVPSSTKLRLFQRRHFFFELKQRFVSFRFDWDENCSVFGDLVSRERVTAFSSSLELQDAQGNEEANRT